MNALLFVQFMKSTPLEYLYIYGKVHVHELFIFNVVSQ